MSDLPGILAYHKSIALELDDSKNRVRNLIGSRHWLSDGEHKETLLRRLLRSHVPETVNVGSGFVYLGVDDSSHQLDILISDLITGQNSG